METKLKNKQVIEAAKHFENLYQEEIAAGEVTGNTIHEWWTQTVDQYSELSLDDLDLIEKKSSINGLS